MALKTTNTHTGEAHFITGFVSGKKAQNRTFVYSCLCHVASMFALWADGGSRFWRRLKIFGTAILRQFEQMFECIVYC